jgi:YebC/PmpR family DNA-binding regulatory protein
VSGHPERPRRHRTKTRLTWPDIPNGPTSSTARVARTKSAGAAFSKIAKEITVAAKMGGGDPGFNPRLRWRRQGQGVNMPKDKIDNAIKKGTGELEGVDYVEIRYEGYGIGGAAVMVDCLTDNKTRTVAEVRHAFSKYGGNMGTDGCVAFQFKHCGQLLFAPGTDEAALMDAAIEAGAEDVLTNDDGSIEVITGRTITAVKEALEGRLHRRVRRGHDEGPRTKSNSPATTPRACRSCSTRWKAWTTCRRFTPACIVIDE